MAIEAGVLCRLHCLTVLFVSCCPWGQLSKAGRGCLVPFCFSRISSVFLRKSFSKKWKVLKGVDYKHIAQLGDLQSDSSEAWSLMDIGLSHQYFWSGLDCELSPRQKCSLSLWLMTFSNLLVVMYKTRPKLPNLKKTPKVCKMSKQQQQENENPKIVNWMETTKECHSRTPVAGDISIWLNVEVPTILEGPKAAWEVSSVTVNKS